MTYLAKTRTNQTCLESSRSDVGTSSAVSTSHRFFNRQDSLRPPQRTRFSSKQSHPLRQPVPGPPLASTRGGWPVATPALTLPERNAARREARCDQRLQPTHTIQFSKTSTRVLCGYCRRFPFDSESPSFTLAIHFGGPTSQMKSLLFPSSRHRPSLCCSVISAHLAETM